MVILKVPKLVDKKVLMMVVMRGQQLVYLLDVGWAMKLGLEKACVNA